VRLGEAGSPKSDRLTIWGLCKLPYDVCLERFRAMSPEAQRRTVVILATFSVLLICVSAAYPTVRGFIRQNRGPYTSTIAARDTPSPLQTPVRPAPTAHPMATGTQATNARVSSGTVSVVDRPHGLAVTSPIQQGLRSVVFLLNQQYDSLAAVLQAVGKTTCTLMLPDGSQIVVRGDAQRSVFANALADGSLPIGVRSDRGNSGDCVITQLLPRTTSEWPSMASPAERASPTGVSRISASTSQWPSVRPSEKPNLSAMSPRLSATSQCTEIDLLVLQMIPCGR
jgi:hypothetical protein